MDSAVCQKSKVSGLVCCRHAGSSTFVNTEEVQNMIVDLFMINNIDQYQSCIFQLRASVQLEHMIVSTGQYC